MTFFLDANIVVYSRVPGRYRQSCLMILESVTRGTADGRTSTAALEEVWHLECSGRVGQIDGLTEQAHTILAPLLAVTDEIFGRALQLDAPSVGTNDRLHAATALENGIDVVVSADSGFDEMPGIRRVDPLDSDAVEALLRD